MQTIYAIMNEKEEYFSSETDGVMWWSKDFLRAKLYANKELAQRAARGMFRANIVRIDINPILQ